MSHLYELFENSASVCFETLLLHVKIHFVLKLFGKAVTKLFESACYKNTAKVQFTSEFVIKI